MTIRIPLGSPLILNWLAPDGATGKFVRARVYNASMAEVSGSPFSLSHVAEGLYKNTAVSLPEGNYVAIYSIFNDAGFTIPAAYPKAQDYFDVTTITTLQAIAEAVWRLARSGNQPAGSFGEFIDASQVSAASAILSAVSGVQSTSNTINAKLGTPGSTVSGDLASVKGDTSTLIGRITSGRAANLDNLDVAVSTRAASISAVDVASAVWNAPRASYNASGSFGEYIDAAVSTRATQVSVNAIPSAGAIADAVWDEAGAGHTAPGSFGSRLDATITSRESEVDADGRETANAIQHAQTQALIGSPVSSVSGDIAAVKGQTASIESKVDGVKAKTDQLAFTGGNVNANSQVVSDKTGYALSSAAEDSLVDKVWDEPISGHLTSGSTGKKLDDGDAVANVSAIADAVWDEVRTGHNTAGTFGEYIDAAISSRAAASSITSIGNDVTYIKNKSDQIFSQTDAATIAGAVWNAARSSYTASGSFGEASQGVLSAARATLIDNLSRLDVVVSTRADQTTASAAAASASSVDGKLTSGRAAALDNLDAQVSTRASQTSVNALPSVGAIADGVWDEATAGHNSAGTFGAKVTSLANGPTAADVADAVWDEARAGHVAAGSFGEVLDAKVSLRATQTSVDDIKGTGFNASTDTLEKIRDKIDTLPTTAGDATAANQATIISALGTKASQSSVNTLQTSVNAIPTNPALTTDPRLANLDATISSRAQEATLTQIKGAGFNASTDTLEAIRDAVAAGLDAGPILADLAQIKGVGFNSADHSLKEISDDIQSSISAANAAAGAANAANSAIASKASQASVNAIASAVASIPTNPALSTDPRFAYLDATISSRVAGTAFSSSLGGTFNPATDSLEAIRDKLDSFTIGDAQEATLTSIIAILSTKASQSGLNALQTSVNAIPINPVLVSDARLSYLDASVSSRALESTLTQIKGAGFDSGTDTLEKIRDAIPAVLDLTAVNTKLDLIMGVGFVSGIDDLKHLNDTAKQERASIKSDTQALLSSGVGT